MKALLCLLVFVAVFLYWWKWLDDKEEGLREGESKTVALPADEPEHPKYSVRTVKVLASSLEGTGIDYMELVASAFSQPSDDQRKSVRLMYWLVENLDGELGEMHAGMMDRLEQHVEMND